MVCCWLHVWFALAVRDERVALERLDAPALVYAFDAAPADLEFGNVWCNRAFSSYLGYSDAPALMKLMNPPALPALEAGAAAGAAGAGAAVTEGDSKSLLRVFHECNLPVCIDSFIEVVMAGPTFVSSNSPPPASTPSSVSSTLSSESTSSSQASAAQPNGTGSTTTTTTTTKATSSHSPPSSSVGFGPRTFTANAVWIDRAGQCVTCVTRAAVAFAPFTNALNQNVGLPAFVTIYLDPPLRTTPSSSPARTEVAANGTTPAVKVSPKDVIAATKESVPPPTQGITLPASTASHSLPATPFASPKPAALPQPQPSQPLPPQLPLQLPSAGPNAPPNLPLNPQVSGSCVVARALWLALEFAFVLFCLLSPSLAINQC